jgi:hypothetical protein
MILQAKRLRAFALKKVDKIEKARTLLTEILQQKIADDAAAAKKRDDETTANSTMVTGGMESLTSGEAEGDRGAYPIS